MLKKFTVTNYKNFRQPLTIDFSRVGGYRFNTDCISNGVITKFLIYGRNATGKTNLGMAIMDIKNILFDVKSIDYDVFYNADSDEKTVEFAYEFEFDGDLLQYSYSLDENRTLYTEKLFLNNHKIFDIDFLTGTYDVNLQEIHAETVVIDRYRTTVEELGKQGIGEKHPPFLRWLLFNTVFGSASPLMKLNSYVRGMRMKSIRFTVQNIPEQSNNRFYERLAENGNLKSFQSFLNAMGIECELIMERLPDGRNELYFKHNVLVPFVKNASSGTIALMNFYISFILPAAEASFFYLDEFDAFYHYEMSDHVIQYMKQHYPKCQLIMTTHNTNLMSNRLMRPDCLLILSRNGSLTALCDATERELREGHNLEKMYISGEFEKYE